MRKGKSRVQERKAVVSSHSLIPELTFQEALEIFVTAKKAEGMRPRTIHDYYKHMEWFQRFLSEFHPDITKIQQLFWTEEGYLPANPMEKIKLLKSDSVDDLRGFTEKELKKLFGVLDTRQYSGFRDKIIMLLMLDTGIRINEVCNIKIQHLDRNRLTLTIPAEVAKNRKSRTLPVSRKVMKMMVELHEGNKEYFDEQEHVFLTAYGEPMIPDTFRRRLWKYAEEAGVERATPHMFRHTFARDYLLNGGDLFTLQIILDHADISTTRRYIQMDDKHVKEQHLKFSPASKYL